MGAERAGSAWVEGCTFEFCNVPLPRGLKGLVEFGFAGTKLAALRGAMDGASL